MLELTTPSSLPLRPWAPVGQTSPPMALARKLQPFEPQRVRERKQNSGIAGRTRFERALITPPVVSSELDRCQRLEWLCRELDVDQVARPDIATGNDDTHDAGLADEATVVAAFQGRLHQPSLNAV